MVKTLYRLISVLVVLLSLVLCSGQEDRPITIEYPQVLVPLAEGQRTMELATANDATADGGSEVTAWYPNAIYQTATDGTLTELTFTPSASYVIEASTDGESWIGVTPTVTTDNPDGTVTETVPALGQVGTYRVISKVFQTLSINNATDGFTGQTTRTISLSGGGEVSFIDALDKTHLRGVYYDEPNQWLAFNVHSGGIVTGVPEYTVDMTPFLPLTEAEVDSMVANNGYITSPDDETLILRASTESSSLTASVVFADDFKANILASNGAGIGIDAFEVVITYIGAPSPREGRAHYLVSQRYTTLIDRVSVSGSGLETNVIGDSNPDFDITFDTSSGEFTVSCDQDTYPFSMYYTIKVK